MFFDHVSLSEFFIKGKVIKYKIDNGRWMQKEYIAAKMTIQVYAKWLKDHLNGNKTVKPLWVKQSQAKTIRVKATRIQSS